ncbi:MAG TPA: NAD(P)-dependent oxidoreductase [Acidimicrobiales bacterium]|nr:NAD(P)-dependent oxidoreductase [Acidimicrobiales bacterium]
MTAVGVIGLGEIGGSVVSAMVTAGHDVAVYDVRSAASDRYADRCRVATGAADLGRDAEAVFVAVLDDDQVRSVLIGPTGAVSTMRPGTTAVVLSTVSVAALRDVATVAHATGVSVVDCGVSGGPAAAAAGTFVSMVGGDEDEVAKVAPLIESFSSVVVVRIGPLGAGMEAKLARNVVQYGSWFAAYEAQRIAEAAGLDLLALSKVIRESDKLIGGASALMFRGTVEPFGPGDDPALVEAMRSAAALARKDLRAAQALGNDLSVELPLVDLLEPRIGPVFGMER